MDWYDRLGSLKEVIGLVVAVVGLVTAVISRKQVVVHLQKSTLGSIQEQPTSSEESTANPVAVGNGVKKRGAGCFVVTILIVAGILGLGLYLVQPEQLGSDHMLPQLLIVLGGFFGAFGFGNCIAEHVFGEDVIGEKPNHVTKGSPEEALYEIKSDTAMIIIASLLYITWICEAIVFGKGKTVTTILEWLSAFLALAIATALLLFLPMWWIRYRLRRWRSERV